LLRFWKLVTGNDLYLQVSDGPVRSDLTEIALDNRGCSVYDKLTVDNFLREKNKIPYFDEVLRIWLSFI